MFGNNSIKITYQKPYYYVEGFNKMIIRVLVKRLFKTRRVFNFIQQSGKYFDNKHTFKIHEFFIPELVYILGCSKTVICQLLKNKLMMETWYKCSYKYNECNESVPNIVDFSAIKDGMNVQLKDYQVEFLKNYGKKVVYGLNGYLLAFEQGLGKTLTGLALMCGLKKKSVIVVCPKSTIINVWKYHIDTYFKGKKKIWIANYSEKDPVGCDFYLVNYESLSKLRGLPIDKDCGIVVDESHNFLTDSSERTLNLLYISRMLKCKDVLMMSGTPLKAIGTEMIPMLRVLDPRFDDQAVEIFINSFGLSTSYASKIFHNRLGLFMYRKLKTEVLKLPDKHEITLNVKFPNAMKYTLSSVKDLVIQYYRERKKYYKDNEKLYLEMYNECISYLDRVLKDDRDYITYKKNVYTIRFNVNSSSDMMSFGKIVHWTVEYERKVLYPLLPNNLKKKFKESKSVVKYVFLKIFGEIIGGLLIHLRDEMCQQMIKFSNIQKIIADAEKKTILFTSYRNCAEVAKNYYKMLGFNPVVINGDNSKNCTPIINQFKVDPKLNPLIATIQTLSTGVTITEANTIVFLNKPWRYIEYQQASDRIHRIGQDTDVYIYTLVLDTGNEPNLSTRMEEIEQWSKEMFETIVDNVEPSDKLLIQSLMYQVRT